MTTKSRKKVNEQTIVITGASSGIGLAAATLAAGKGARVVLASRNEKDLREICEKLEKDGGTAAFVKADVSKEDDIRKIAAQAIETFGGFDTWVNNAGVGLFGNLMDIPIEDERRLFDVNFWGVVHGSRIALSHLREKGGTIINIGSILSDRAFPLQGTYSASKHAVKAFSDALRMEIEKENIPVTITTLKPGSVNTPFMEHARNRMNEKVILPPPYYDPDVVARAIVQCSQTSHRDLAVANVAGSVVIQMEHLFPGTLDNIMKRTVFDLQKRKNEPKNKEDGLYKAPSKEGRIRGRYAGPVLKHNLNTSIRLDPKKLWAVTAVGLSAVAGVIGFLRK
ncbi:MAG: SDR family oxidoreductase [Balneolaceae bacterium]